MEKSPLNPTTEQFSRLEYSLQVSARASTIRIRSAFIVSNPTWTIQFDKRAEDVMCVDCWIDAVDLCQSQTIDDVLRKLTSSNFPSGGLPVNSGKLSVTSTHTKVVKNMVYCRVAIGRAYVVDSKDQAKTLSLPAGYDSFYVKKQAVADNSTTTSSGAHWYWVKTQDQVLPLFAATVEYDPIAEKRSRERPVCDNCEKVNASVYCAADSAYLCKDCDVNLHMSKITQKHQRNPLGKGPDAFGSCRAHQEAIEYFCSNCHLPVCIHCKMIGHHSTGEASKHKLVRVTEAFETVLKESSKDTNCLDGRLSAIEKQLRQIRNRRQEVDNLEKSLESQLKRLYEQAMTQLHEAIKNKRTILMGDEFELMRQTDEMRNLEEFLEYQRSAVDMFHLLFSWSTHQAMRQNMQDFKFFRDHIDVELDLKVDGNLKIGQESSRPDASPSKKTGAAGGLVGNAPANTMKKSGGADTIELGKMSLRKTSDFFAEALTAMDGHHGGHERISYVNNYDIDERSVTATGYGDDYC